VAAVRKEKPTPVEEQRAQFAQYKADVKKRGKSFYPYAMFHDTVMSLVVVTVIIALAAIWKWTSYGPHHDGLHPGLLGPEYNAPADPGTTSFVPRPDWYFYFLFYLLRIFKWPESVFLGTIGVPTICLVLLLLLPFLDRRRTRGLGSRPVALVAAVLVVLSMGVLTFKGATANEALASEVIADVPTWVTKNNLPPEAHPERCCSRPRAVRRVTRTSARAARTSARRTCRTSARGTSASPRRSSTCRTRRPSLRGRRCRRSPRSARSACTSSRSSSKPRKAGTRHE